jgi:hypothetical protein
MLAGELDAASELAVEGLARLSAAQISSPAVDGYAGLFEVFFALWKRERDAAARRRLHGRLKHSLQLLRRFGLQVRAARPIWLLLSGRYHLELGDRSAAVRRFRWALEDARRMEMRPAAALAGGWLGHLRGGAAGQAEIRAGIESLRSMQALGDVAQLAACLVE